MADIQKLVSVFLAQLLLVLLTLDFTTNAQNLQVGFYRNTCPDLEHIVAMTTYNYISRAPTLAAPLLRMHFHDCFVRVCILIGCISFCLTYTNKQSLIKEYL